MTPTRFKPMPVHVGLYVKKEPLDQFILRREGKSGGGMDSTHSCSFLFLTGPHDSLARLAEYQDHVRLGIKRLPRAFVEARLVRYLQKADRADLGWIEYRVFGRPRSRQVAMSHMVYPKRGLPDNMGRMAPGLGSWLEAWCVSHLKRQGVSRISTSSDPRRFRRAHLVRARLPISVPVRARRWLKGLGRTMRGASSALRRRDSA